MLVVSLHHYTCLLECVCVSISAFLIVCSSQLEADWGEMDRWKKRGKIGGKVVEDTVEKREKERDKDEYN